MPTTDQTSTIGCPHCGGQTRIAWRRLRDGQLHPLRVCADCPAVISTVPEPRPASGQTAKFQGWHRAEKRSKWQAVVTGTSEGEAMDRLLDARLGGDKLVLPDGRNPNCEARPR